jgi:glutaminyl-peptide cyclotransferase
MFGSVIDVNSYVGSVGSENNTLVKDYLVSTMKGLGWHVEEDSFTDMTPYGIKHFTNVIATKDPAAARRVILSAHFDSKFFPSAPQNQVRANGSVLI